MNPRRAALLVVLSAPFVVLACEKPAPPRITPKEARVMEVSPSGIDLLIKVEAFNPNAVTLSAQSLTGKAKLDNQWELGTITITKPVVLPPNATTPIEVPLSLPWTDLKTLGALATANRPVPYVVEGTVRVGGERLNVDVPFSIAGTLTREQLAAATMKSLKNLPKLGP